MALRVPCGSLLRKILIVGVSALTCTWLQAPAAFAQHGAHGSGHAGAGGQAGGGHATVPHAVAPPAARAPISRPPVVFGPRAAFGQRPIFTHHRVFLRPPFFRLRGAFYTAWWLNCVAAWTLDFGCGWRVPEYPVENYVAPPLVIYEPESVYYGGPRELVLLFLKDGTVYSVPDYWFVNDEVHFTELEEGGTKSAEHVIGLDELDLRKTTDVNTRRGFRFVRRDQPLEQYLRDHPDANPPLIEPPQKN